MTREEMMDNVARNNGLENKWTILFFKLAENKNIPDTVVKIAYTCALANIRNN